MKKSIIIIIAVVAVIVIWAVSMYNGLVTMDENVNSRPLKSIFQRKILFYECFADFFQ